MRTAACRFEQEACFDHNDRSYGIVGSFDRNLTDP